MNFVDFLPCAKASEIFLKYEERLNNKDDLTIDDIYLCEALFGLISYYQQVGDYSKMLKYSKEAYNIAFNLYQKKPINRHEYNLLNGLSIYILSLRVNNKIEDAFILIKETSVASFIAVVDLQKACDNIRNANYNAWIPLLSCAVIYLCLTLGLTKLFSLIEKRMAKSDRSK